jgi:hypothetical protein
MMNAPPGKVRARHANAAGPEDGQQGERTDADRSTSEAPEHRGDRRRFLVWALMLGATTPERVVERVVAELEQAGN